MKTMNNNEAGSANQIPNQELTNKNREEGEVSSSDDEENPGSCSAHATAAVGHPAVTVPASKYSQGTQMVKNASGNNLSCTVDIQPRNTTQSNSLKSFEQNRVTFKSNTPGWFPSSGKNDNLVISFSDDDSGSDTEDHRHKTAFENKSNTTRVDGSGRPPTSSAVKVKNLQQTARNVSKAIPKKLSPSQTLTTTRNHGGANSWVSRPPSVDQRSQVRNFSIKKKLGSLECGDQVGLRNSKLQDLRQQIALRESELKLKAAQQNKDLVIDSCENYHLGRLDQKEPDKKRLKVSGSYSHRLTTDGRQDIPATKSTVPVKEPTPERSSLQDGNKVDRSQKDIPRSRIESEIVKWDKQNGKQVHVPPENVLSVVKDVANPNTSCNQSDRDSRQVNSGPVLHNTSQLANMTSSNFPKNAAMEMFREIAMWTYNHYLTWRNCWTRSWRKHKNTGGFRALIEANASCTKLYRQRELCSARFRSFVMDDSNLLWSSGQHETLGNEFDLSKHVSGNMHLAPTSTHQMQSGYNFSHEHENGQNLGSEPCSEPDARRQISTDYRHNNKLSAVSSQDPLLLEATLRSELFARLGMRTFSKDSGSCFNVEPSVEQRADNDIGSDKMQMSNGSVPSSGEQSQQHDIGGTDKPERRIQEAPFQIQDKCLVEKGLLEFHSTYHSKGNKFPTRMNHSTSVLLSPPILRGAFGHLKTNSKPDIVKGYVGKEMGSYTCNLAIDPLWPLCMYELRGKCNNDECPWQHVKYFADRNKNLHDDSDSAARRHGLCWQKCLSISLAISSIYPKDLPADLSLIGDGRIECIGSWNRQSSFFRSRNGVLLSNEQCVEMALLILNQDANKLEGMKKALSLLSRALEADPTSEILWITYLLIFYSNTNSVGKDDMFSYSVKHNEGSYALWLMYINSRTPLNHRLDAYDAALSVLCRCASASDGDEMHASACILDLFLQMLQCFCMSGNTEKAIQRISRLLIPATGSNDRHSLFLSDILTCLTISDKLIFWVCCVYLVIYRKLPDAVLQLLECEKELFAIDWPPVQLEDDEKQRAIKLIEMAVNSVELYSNGESLEKETNLRSAHCFAVNHIRCMAVLNGLECSMNLLEKYIKSYPSCLELVLMKARLQKHDFGDLSSVGFEEALIKWPKGVPGIQCIWNQYVEYALQNGRHDFAAELMDRWFHSVWKVQYDQVEISDPLVADMSHSSPESTSTSDPEFSVSNRNQMDVMFGYLNLSLHRLLQNDCNEARLAIDAALKAAASEHFKHCVREHAMFLLINESEPKEGAPIGWQLKLLNSYLDRARSLPYLKLLPRQFINNIERPRLQQLIENLLSPVSSDFSLVNLVLEVCYGPSLLPRNFSKLKDLVDFVEGIMEIVPSNYQLAFSVFKLLNKDHNPNITDAVPESVLFWASSSLVSAIFHAVPVAPEYVWVETAGILGNISSIEEISERFFKRALSVYPFSIKLWKCYYDLSKTKGDSNTIVKAAREKGIELD
ncbi:hypothetical protein CUMW_088050 [Citrus unshiu]|nr:hypothetical protein CUMW_088050 [Citrus unshiu]